MDERVQAYIDGLRALTAWMERVGDGLTRSDVSGGLSSYATTAEEFAAKVALLEGEHTIDALDRSSDFVRVRRAFGGGLEFYVYARKAVVLERDDRVELREVEVGEWRFVEPVAGLGPIPDEGGA